MADRYWCHVCSQIVDPVVEIEIMKCPLCDSGFVEEMNSARGDTAVVEGFIDDGNSNNNNDVNDDDAISERSVSTVGPLLLELMEVLARARRLRSSLRRFDDDSDSDQEHDHESVFTAHRRRRRSFSALLQFNSLNQALLQTTNDSDNTEGNENAIGGASFGDYFIGPGLEMLFQHLSENDPNRYGTPPAKKEAVDAMPVVIIDEILNCSVCLDDFDVGSEAREMPCKHKFHGGCILPWLELHSSCPLCRFQIQADESKLSNESSSSDGGNESRIALSLSGLFSATRARRRRNSSFNPSSSSSTSESNSHEDEN